MPDSEGQEGKILLVAFTLVMKELKGSIETSNYEGIFCWY